MPNHYKYNAVATEPQSLRKGNWYIGVGDVPKGPTASTGFWNGITPPVGGYAIYLNKAANGPSIYTVGNDAALISFTNQLAGTGYTTAAECLDYFAGQSDRFCINRDYEPIVTNGLVLNFDAGFVPSYPRSENTWYDIGLDGRNGTLTNGPTFNSANGGSIVFDGTNDHVSILNGSFGYSPGTTGGFSLEIWVYPTGPYTSYTNEPPTTNLGGFIGQSYFGNTVGWGIGMYTSGGINYWAFQTRSFGNILQPPGVAFTNNSWYHVVGSFARNDFSRLYVNGELKSSVSSTGLNGVSITPAINNAAIARGGQGFFSGCKIPISKVYNRALSAAEVLQNYNATKGRYGL